MQRRTGIYSGTFDPIHQGHIAFAQEALRACKLDEVIFLPEHSPRNKDGVTGISHRIALIERATAAIPVLRVIGLTSQQFTVQHTLPELYQTFSNSHLTLLAGSDVVRASLRYWKGIDVLLRKMPLAIGLRSNDSPAEIATILSRLSQDLGIAVDYTIVSAPHADMTASQIRISPAALSRLNPDMVDYIQKHRLYART